MVKNTSVLSFQKEITFCKTSNIDLKKNPSVCGTASKKATEPILFKLSQILYKYFKPDLTYKKWFWKISKN